MALNIGGEKKVEITVEIVSLSDKLMDSHVYANVILPEGRTAIRLEPIKPKVGLEGLFKLRYSVNEYPAAK